VPTADVPVLVIGAGPTGLAASLTLSRLGVEHVLADRHAGPLHHPKAVGIMQRTAELLRGWEAEDEIRARGVPPHFCQQMLWVTTLSGEELGRTATPDPDAARDAPVSPCSAYVRCPQHITETVLRARAEAHDAARIRYGVQVAALAADDHGVTATVVDRDSGAEESLRAGWVIAADGNDSGVRADLGIGRTGRDDMGHFINIFFRAPLGPLVADRPAWSYAVLTPELIGTFVTLDGADEWILHRNLVPGERLEDFPPERCVEVVRHAAGVPELPVEIIGVHQWIMGAQLSTRFRDGRIVLTGDAAHRTTPDGGVGMNTGIASAHNAAWKVGAVAAGWAGPALLDTYEEERRAVAQRNVDYSAGRGEGMTRMAEAVRAGDLDTLRAGIAARGAMGTRQGMDLGYTYASAAVVPDGTDPPALEDQMRDYVPTARPGARAPHVPLGDGRSTLDLFGAGMVLLAGSSGDAWVRAARDVAADVPLEAHTPHAAAADGAFESAYGIGADGAVLVRPDGFVAWRSAGASPEPDRELGRALGAVLAR
jgi:putative polyketide hydroxylase